MQNLLLTQFNPLAPGTTHVLPLTQYDYLRVIAGKLIKIDRQTQDMCGSKFKLVCGDMFGYYYLYAVLGDRGYFAKSLHYGTI